MSRCRYATDSGGILVCYGCGGTGFRLTAKAKKSKLSFYALRKEMTSIPARDVVAGMRHRHQSRVVCIEKVEGPNEQGQLFIRMGNYSRLVYDTTMLEITPNPEQWDALVSFAKTLPDTLITN